MTNGEDAAFNGEAINRADREFLASLHDHPLVRHPLYSTRCPPPNANNPDAAFQAALDWMLVNYGYFGGAYLGRGGIISLVDGQIVSKSSWRDLMMTHVIEGPPGPNGGKPKLVHVVDVMLRHPQRIQIDGIQCRCDKPRPTFEEDGVTIYNRYWPPAHPKSGGEIETFKGFLARLIPDEKERKWLWDWLAHKIRKPWVPMIAIIMVGEEFGSGRGTLFEILELIFGEDYVVPCSFGEITGRAPGARFNTRYAHALIATIGEADDEDEHLQARRRLTFEALKNAIEPSERTRKPNEMKGHDSVTQRCARSTIIATQHRDLIKLPSGDRRICVLTCGIKMTVEQRKEIRDWMATPDNIGALSRALLETPAARVEEFDPYGDPPPFAGRLAMIGMGRTRLEDAYEAAIDALEGFPLFTMTQATSLISYFGDFRAVNGDWSDKARHTVAKNAYRLRERGEPNNRIQYGGRYEVLYARTKAEQRRWRGADTALIVKQLDAAKAMIVQCINSERTDLRTGLEKLASLQEETREKSSPMSNAERQRRWYYRHKKEGKPPPSPSPPPPSPSPPPSASSPPQEDEDA